MDSKWKKSMIESLDDLPSDYQVDTIATGPKFLELLLDHTKTLNLSHFHLGGALGDVAFMKKR